MKKYNQTNKCLMFMSLFLFFALASGVVAACLKNYFVAIGTVACVLIYLVLYIVAVKKCEYGKSFFVLSWEIVFVGMIIVALTPLACVAWVVEVIAESVHKKNERY